MVTDTLKFNLLADQLGADELALGHQGDRGTKGACYPIIGIQSFSVEKQIEYEVDF